MYIRIYMFVIALKYYEILYDIICKCVCVILCVCLRHITGRLQSRINVITDLAQRKHGIPGWHALKTYAIQSRLPARCFPQGKKVTPRDPAGIYMLVAGQGRT